MSDAANPRASLQPVGRGGPPAAEGGAHAVRRRRSASASCASAAIQSEHATVSGKKGKELTMKRAFWTGVSVCATKHARAVTPL